MSWTRKNISVSFLYLPSPYWRPESTFILLFYSTKQMFSYCEHFRKVCDLVERKLSDELDNSCLTPILWSPHAKSWLIGKDSDAGRDWGLEEKGMTEDEMAGWHHWLDGHEFGKNPGAGDEQGGLACCNSWGHKESDMTLQLNWIELNLNILLK